MIGVIGWIGRIVTIYCIRKIFFGGDRSGGRIASNPCNDNGANGDTGYGGRGGV